jgi:hypothetical protein
MLTHLKWNMLWISAANDRKQSKETRLGGSAILLYRPPLTGSAPLKGRIVKQREAGVPESTATAAPSTLAWFFHPIGACNCMRTHRDGTCTHFSVFLQWPKTRVTLVCGEWRDLPPLLLAHLQRCSEIAS